jgi:predicted PurR-regulated permease PerM
MLWLRRYIGRTAAALLLAAIVVVTVAGFGTILAGQFTNLARNLPTYQYNLQTKLHGFADAAGGDSVVKRALSLWQSLRDEAEKTAEDKTTPAAKPAEGTAPIPVIIHEPPPQPMEVIQGVVGPLLSPLASAGMVVLFMTFMLLNREVLRDRFIRLAGAGNLGRTTEALDEAASRVSRYLLMQLIVNMLYGVPIGIGLYLIGVPNAALWGGLAIVMRFVPYIGPWIAAAFPLVLSIAIAPGWGAFFETAGLFIVIELVTGNVIEPWLYGSSTGLSSIAVILAAVVWTWLWGFVGLILSIPLTVCLVVIGRHVPRLEFLSILLGDEPVLTPIQKFYQRLLAADPDEATEQAEACMKDLTVGAFYDDIVIPALAMAEADRERGVLDPDRLAVMAETASEVTENLEDQSFRLRLHDEEGAQDRPTPAVDQAISVLCVPGSRITDRIAALYLADLLRRHGFQAKVGKFGDGLPLDQGESDRIDVVCISCITRHAAAQARYLTRRLRRVLPRAKMVVGFWSDAHGREEGLQSMPADAVVASFGGAIDVMRTLAAPTPRRNVTAADEPAPADVLLTTPARG